MTLPTPMKIVLAVFIIILIGLGFWLADWQRKLNDISARKKTLQEKVDELSRNKQLVAELPVQKQKNKDLQEQLKQVIQEQITPETEAEFVPNYISNLEKLVDLERRRMNDSSFTILSLTPGAQTTSTVGGEQKPAAEAKPEETGNQPKALADYPVRMFQMSMKGQYLTLIDFLRQLGALKLKRLVTINKLSLSPAEVPKGGGSPTLNITIPITAYLSKGGATQ